MARNKSGEKKARLIKQGRRTKWAPFWSVFKAYGKGKRIHPSRLTSLKRNWRKTKLKMKPSKRRRASLG